MFGEYFSKPAAFSSRVVFESEDECALVSNSPQTDRPSHRPSPGDRIRITSGALAGHEGTVTERLNSDRLRVSLDSPDAVFVEIDRYAVACVS